MHAEQFKQKPLVTMLHANYDPEDPNKLGVVLRFPDGSVNMWELVYPPAVVDEPWVRAALRSLVGAMIGDLRDGRSSPATRANPQMYFRTDWDRITQELHAMIWAGDKRRVELARTSAKAVPTMSAEDIANYQP